MKKFWKSWKLPKPKSATIEQWQEWKTYSKKEHPVKYFLQESIPRKISYIKYYLHRKKWEFLHRFHPSHRYHVIKPSTLEPGWHDTDKMLLHTVMHLLSRFLKEELPNSHSCTTLAEYIDGVDPSDFQYKALVKQGTEAEAVFKEMHSILEWWENEWPNRDRFDIRGNEMPNYPCRKWFSQISREEKREIVLNHANCEEEWRLKENEMMKKVIDLRHYMWT